MKNAKQNLNRGSYWQPQVIKAADVVYEDRIGQDPVMTRFGRIVRQPMSNGLGMGIIDCEDMSAEWFLNYDEIFYVLEGNFRCVIDGEVLEAFEGDTIFLPKNTQLRYETTGKARVMYIVYPESNGGWRNLIGHD